MTEMDVKCKLNRTGAAGDKSSAKCIYPDWPAAELEKQTNVFNGLLKVCLEEAACKSFETWGFTDKYSWLPNPDDGLPRTNTYGAKPALVKMVKTLQDFPRDSASVV